MTELMQGLAEEAKKKKYSSIDPNLTDEDVVSVWENVSTFIDKQMSQQKGVTIPGFGTFTFTQQKLDVGNNKYILIQRPVFSLSEKFAQTHGLNSTKHHVAGQIPVVQLNYAALSYESPFDRDTVESCVKEVLNAVARSLSVKRNVEFQFHGIGRLQIRDGKVKMKFYKDFLNSMDGSGKLVDALKDRPGTVDSVMSNRSPSRALTSNTVVLPSPSCCSPDGKTAINITLDCISCVRIPAGGSGDEGMPAIQEEDDAAADMDLTNDIQPTNLDIETTEDKTEKKSHSAGARAPSRQAAPIAQATGVSFADDLMPPMSPKAMRGTPPLKSPTPMMLKRSLSPIQSPHPPPPLGSNRPHFERSKSLDAIPAAKRLEILDPIPTPLVNPDPPLPPTELPAPEADKPPGSACGHNAGQELCYLCHQRESRNIPVSFTEERKRREMEEDTLLQQYQHMKDTEELLKEQENGLAKKHEDQKIAAFNLGVSEAVKMKKMARELNFHPSYIFQKRPLTPPRFIKQDMYSGDLAKQVNAKEEASKKKKADEEFLERLEQVQLAEDLAAQRQQYLQDKVDQQEQYKRALSAQITIGAQTCISPMTSRPQLGPLTLPRPKVLIPFAQTYTVKLQESGQKKLVRFKPLPVPARLPDSSSPVFGRNDMNSEKLAERRRQAHGLYQQQLATVEQRKRDAILKRLTEQKQEEDMLQRTKQELIEDRASRYDRMFRSRKHLETEWMSAHHTKQTRDEQERMLHSDPGMLLHEQCDKYNRCGQCKRRVNNCGESNIWRESRYIPGSRLMV